MKISIIGWYGTETIGDRAILAGIFRILSNVFDRFDVSIGSLFPILTKRTILHDSDFFRDCSCNKIVGFNLFDSLSPDELNSNLKNSDLLLIGGGPLMDIPAMYMLDYAFKRSSKLGIPTLVLGCGIGPLKSEEYKGVAASILNNTDAIILRDSNSIIQLNELVKDHVKAVSSVDPAVFAADFYNRTVEKSDINLEPYIAINFRDIGLDSYEGDAAKYEKSFGDLLKEISQHWNCHIHLVPMHTFSIGGDDREILTRLWLNTGRLENIHVIQKPLSLVETMNVYKNALLCFGMRFHSVVLQTILNGSNFILDYTDKENGKIYSLIKDLQIESQLEGRYVSLCKEPIENLKLGHKIDKIFISENFIKEKMETYVNAITKLIKC